jgi:hypothetical protein
VRPVRVKIDLNAAPQQLGKHHVTGGGDAARVLSHPAVAGKPQRVRLPLGPHLVIVSTPLARGTLEL